MVGFARYGAEKVPGAAKSEARIGRFLCVAAGIFITALLVFCEGGHLSVLELSSP